MATAKKAPAKKATPAKKAPAKKAAAAKAAPASDTKLAADIAKRVKAGESVSAIAAALGVNAVTVNRYKLEATVERVKEAPTPTRIKTGRDKDGHSWKVLSIMYGIPKAKVQELYKEAGGDPRESSVAKAPAAKKAAGTAKAPAKKAAAAKKDAAKPAPTGKPVFDKLLGGDWTGGVMDAETKAAIVEKVDGKTISRRSSLVDTDELEEINVKAGSVKAGAQKDGTRVIQFHDGDKTRTVALSAIVKVSR